MSSPRIEVEIVAKVEGLAAGVNTATGQLDKLGKSVEGTAPKIGKLSQATGNYNAVGVNFARLIQDLPYGIIGVGNNITALAESFDQASNKGQSIGQVLGGIFSAGNLLTLGISAAVTAWTLYSQNTEKVVDINEKVSESYKELQEQIDQTVNVLSTLKFVNDIIVQQQDEVRKLNKDFNIFTLTAEDAAKITTDAFAKLNKTQLTGIKSTLSELADENLKVLGNSLNLTRKEAIKFAESFNGNTAGFEALSPKIRDAVSGYKSFSQEVKLAGEQLAFYDDKEEKIDFRKEALDKYSQSWDDYNLSIETAQKLTDRLTFSSKDYDKAIQNVLTRNESIGLVPQITGDNAWDQYTFSVYQFRDASIKANEEITNTSTKALEFGERIKSLSGKEVKINLKVEGFDETAGPSPFDVFIDSVAYAVDQLPTFEQRIADFAFAVSDILDNNLGNAFADLGNSIGEALATGGNVLSAVGKSLLGSVGNLLGDFGKQLIAFGVAGLAYSSLIKSLFTDPVTAAPKAGLAIAAGVALVAISGAISSSMRSNSGGGGGGGGGSSVGSSGVGGGSSFVGGGAQGGMFAANKDLNGELVVRGQDLVYVFGQANNRINKG
jgi:hypothetical protein